MQDCEILYDVNLGKFLHLSVVKCLQASYLGSCKV
jgi:hypothetical protein